jgi:glycosyltransferase involved in cell wall biosynthesis
VRTFLLITPYFAPQATVGAYRWVKLSRHLVRRGFRPVVLCGTFPADPRDPDLASALPSEVIAVDDYLDPRILAAGRSLTNLSARIRVRSDVSPKVARPLEGLAPSRLLLDRAVAHAYHASRVATDLARRHDACAVVVSAGPFSAVPVGFHVGRKLGLPVILDFRDPFGLHESGNEPPRGIADRVRARIVAAAEHRWMMDASHVVLNSRNSLDAYRDEYPFLENKSSFIRNHYDLGLYDPVATNIAPPSRFTILHTGTLRAETRLDDIGAALRLMIERDKLTPDDIVLRQIGRITEFERAQIQSLGLERFIEVVPTIPQRAILGELRRGHVLLSMVDPRVRLRIAAKTYDYIASGMPIVSVTENAEVDELLAHRSDNVRLRPGDVQGLAAVLSARFAHFRQTGALPVPVEAPREFSSEMAAERFANVIELALTIQQGRGPALS